MSRSLILQQLESKSLKTDIPDFRIGDTVRVHTRIIEGQKERIQMFTGTVIAKKGSGLSETFSLHRVAYGEGMERVFPLHSPRIAMIEIMKEGKVRRAKLYYLRGTSGKASKVKGRLGKSRQVEAREKAEAKAKEKEKENEEEKEPETIIPSEEAVNEQPESESSEASKS